MVLVSNHGQLNGRLVSIPTFHSSPERWIGRILVTPLGRGLRFNILGSWGAEYEGMVESLVSNKKKKRLVSCHFVVQQPPATHQLQSQQGTRNTDTVARFKRIRPYART